VPVSAAVTAAAAAAIQQVPAAGLACNAAAVCHNLELSSRTSRNQHLLELKMQGLGKLASCSSILWQAAAISPSSRWKLD
jgi:hypothetical protein